MPLANGPLGINIQKFLGDLPHRLSNFFLGCLPALGSQAVQLGLLVCESLVFADPVKLINRNIELVVIAIINDQVVALMTGNLHVDQTTK